MALAALQRQDERVEHPGGRIDIAASAGLPRPAQQHDVAGSHGLKFRSFAALPGAASGFILVCIFNWLLLAPFVAVIVLTASGGLAVKRYSGAHVVAHLAVRGRGLYFSRTPDGVWWRLRLRPCRRVCEDRRACGEPPPDSGVREPRRPLGPGPATSACALEAS